MLGGRAVFPTGARSARPSAAFWRRARAVVRSHRRQRSISALAPARNPDVAAIVFRLETVASSGWLRLTPRRLEACRGGRADAAVWRARAGRFPVAAHVEIARTGLLYRALAALVVGDAVVFDGVGADAFAAHASWPGELRVGAFAADVAVDAGGELTLIGGFSRDNEERRR